MGKKPQKKGFFKRVFNWIRSNIYGILYILLLIMLSIYIILNWDKCISMKFFEQFNGNNILFLVWIALIILFFYDIEAKDFKFHRKKFERTMEQYANADSIFRQNQMNNMKNPSPSEQSVEDGGKEQ